MERRGGSESRLLVVTGGGSQDVVDGQAMEFRLHLVWIHLSSTLPAMPAPYTSTASALASPRFVVRVGNWSVSFLTERDWSVLVTWKWGFR